MTSNTSGVGHRQRLRQRFLAESGAFTDTQLLDLFLTYAIPRQDVAPIASRLLETFGSLEKLFAAPHEGLMKLDGIGEAAAILLGYSGCAGPGQVKAWRPRIRAVKLRIFEERPG